MVKIVTWENRMSLKFRIGLRGECRNWLARKAGPQVEARKKQRGWDGIYGGASASGRWRQMINGRRFPAVAGIFKILTVRFLGNLSRFPALFQPPPSSFRI